MPDNKLKPEESVVDTLAVADQIKMILIPLQLLMQSTSIESMEKLLEQMEETEYTLTALPLPETQNKAELIKKKNHLFKCMIELMKSIDAVMNHVDKANVGNELLARMGLL